MVSAFAGSIYDKLRQVPSGQVTTYLELAQAVGSHSYRAVGQVLKSNPFAPEVPCHRVVRSDGRIGGFMGHLGGEPVLRKIQLLQSEGVRVEKGFIVDIERIIYRFKD